MHPRPILETNSSHKLLKRYSSAGPENLHLPPPDYADLDGKDDHEQTPSTDATGSSGLEVFLFHFHEHVYTVKPHLIQTLVVTDSFLSPAPNISLK